MSNVEQAAEILRHGGLVAFPTETVYGLGADATNVAAVAKIFATKGRPSTNPLICHVADESMAKRYAASWPAAASQLAARFWPGPLTIVVPKASSIVPGVTAGLDSVGLRAPDHKLTLELIRLFNGPIAGPSANRSNHVSPTTAQHVRDEFGDAIDMILDGGSCSVGIESTVLDLSTPRPTLLRPGGISREQIESIIGPIEMPSAVASATGPAKSPGQHPVHYGRKRPGLSRRSIRSSASAIGCSRHSRQRRAATIRPTFLRHAARDRREKPSCHLHRISPQRAAVDCRARPDFPRNSTLASLLYRTLKNLICRSDQCIAHLSCQIAVGDEFMLRLVTEDWAARLQARLREEATSHVEVTVGDESAADSPGRSDDRLTFGPYGTSPISGLHFDTPDDTAAS